MNKKFLDTIKKELNESQRKAVECCDGPVAVFAGAGSGKTRVITYKIAYLYNKGVNLENILAVTFTNKAATEMKERVSKLLKVDIKSLWIGTFHSICLRILRRSISEIGLRNDFVVFDEEDSLSLIKDVMKNLNIDIKRINPKSVFNAISDSKINIVTPEKYLEYQGANYFSQIVATVYPIYEIKLRENNALDFDDLILKSVEMFTQKKEILNKYIDIFKYILVDEYQDINYLQYIFLDLLAEKSGNICIVGDDDQSIYSFRGANPSIMTKFKEKYKESTIIKLEENYRSTEMILSAANAVVKNNIKRQEKTLWTKIKGGSYVQLIKAMTERDEAQRIVKIIQDKSKEDNISNNDFVILYRLNAQSRNFEEALINLGIPYQVYGGFKFYQRKEVKDYLAYLRIIANPDDRVSISRVINYPKRNIGSVFVNKIENISKEKNINFLDACKILVKTENFTARGKKGLEEFLEIIEETKNEIGKISLIDLSKNLLERTKLEAAIREEYPEYAAQEKIENLYEVLSAIDRFEIENEDKTLQAFLAQIALVSDIDNYTESEDRVTLMTLHSAKGLEFPVVFLVGLEEGLFPHYLSNNNNEALEEERRLCYVGITRAQRDIYISYALSRELYGKVSKTIKSRFIDEIPEDFLQLANNNSSFNHENESIKTYKKNITKTMHNVPIDIETISEGEMVCHEVWGNGIVKRKEFINKEPIAQILFDSVGEKLLNLKYAPISKVIIEDHK